jgi:hypothetical protein
MLPLPPNAIASEFAVSERDTAFDLSQRQRDPRGKRILAATGRP